MVEQWFNEEWTEPMNTFKKTVAMRYNFGEALFDHYFNFNEALIRPTFIRLRYTMPITTTPQSFPNPSPRISKTP